MILPWVHIVHPRHTAKPWLDVRYDANLGMTFDMAPPVIL